MVGCDGPHDHEMFFVGDLAFGPDEPRPGLDALFDLVFIDLCEGPFQDRYGASSDFAASLTFWASWPFEEDWDAGLRTVECSAAAAFNPIDGEPLVGDGASAGQCGVF